MTNEQGDEQGTHYREPFSKPLALEVIDAIDALLVVGQAVVGLAIIVLAIAFVIKKCN